MKIFFALIASALTSGCVQQYWTKGDLSAQLVAKELHDCRMQINQGGQKVFTAQEMEASCMAAKGFNISSTPPKA